jgi:S-DNA-T family DNA segregation ATPase FtsK/SpoIIIE
MSGVDGAGEPTVTAVAADALGRPLAARPDEQAGQPGTDLAAVVAAMREAAELEGLEAPRRPWTEPLPGRVLLAELEEPAREAGSQIAPLPFALEDRPRRQDRRTVALDLERGGHILFAGSPRSGRSTVLRTIAGAIATRVGPRDVHVYGLDFGNSSALLPIAALPHCGAVVTASQVERVDRLIARLLAEAARRRQLFGEAGFADLAEQRAGAAPDDRLPYVVLLLDRWEGFRTVFQDVDGRRIVDNLERLLREAPSVGIRAVVTGDASAFSGVLSSTIEDRFALRFNDGADYLKAGMDVRKLPARTDRIPAGRAWRVESGTEVQVALLAADPSGPAQVAALRAMTDESIRRHADLPRAARPDPVAQLPDRVTVAEVGPLDRPAALWALVGVGGDGLDPLGLDLGAKGPSFLIAGPPRSGRSTALLGMAWSLLEGGSRIVGAAPRPSPLRELAGAPGVVDVLHGEQLRDGRLRELVSGVEGPLAVCVDDVELLLDDVRMSEALREILRTGRDRGHALVAAGTASDLGGFRGLAYDVRKSRTGLLLSPEGGDLFSMRLPKTALGAGPPGRGLLIVDGRQTPVQVVLR